MGLEFYNKFPLDNDYLKEIIKKKNITGFECSPTLVKTINFNVINYESIHK